MPRRLGFGGRGRQPQTLVSQGHAKMNSSDAAVIVQWHGITSIVLTAGIPLLLWLIILRSWKPQTRLMYSLRFSLWPMIFLSFNLGPAISREIFDIHSTYSHSLEDTLKGFIVLSLVSAPVFFGIGWWRGKSLSSMNRKEIESPKSSGTKMKIASTVLNIMLLGFVIFKLLEHGLPRTDENDFLPFLLFSATPIVTLYYLLFSSNRESWLQLYFRRKAAEEKQKLKQLEDRENR